LPVHVAYLQQVVDVVELALDFVLLFLWYDFYFLFDLSLLNFV
jgi:hypothetical protein